MLVYKITNNANGKIYIGKTVQPIKVRWHHHVSRAKTNDSNMAICKAIRKYGLNNFSVDIILYCEYDEGARYEKALIRAYKSNVKTHGYNLTDGGEGCCGHKHSQKTKQIMSRRKIASFMNGKKSWNYIYGLNPDFIYQTVLKSKSVADATKKLGISRDVIYRRCRGMFDSTFRIPNKRIPSEEVRSLYQKGHTISQIAKTYNTSTATISRRLHGKDINT